METSSNPAISELFWAIAQDFDNEMSAGVAFERAFSSQKFEFPRPSHREVCYNYAVVRDSNTGAV